ncbi:hypothetical protein [Mucilaginibacter sp. CSA2-8R]|uniref:hypothetical protein n=1 Tax=Mucilaginibacter sp. CSA2-8R TaxID=3141542 RepID=UPI00315D2EDF
MYNLAKYNSPNHELTVFHQLSEEEVTFFKDILDGIASFNALTTGFYNVQAPIRQWPELFERDRKADVMRLLGDFLAAFSAFLNFWEQYLKGTYGKDSNNYLNFKQATSEEYDSSFAYRLLYALRNYNQHFGPLPLSVENEIKDNTTIYKLILHKNNLNASYTFKAIVRDELTTLGDRIDLVDYIKELFEIIKRLHVVGLKNSINLNLLIEYSERVLKYAESLNLKEEKLVIISSSVAETEFATQTWRLQNLNPIGQLEDQIYPPEMLYNEVPTWVAEYIVKGIKPQMNL